MMKLPFRHRGRKMAAEDHERLEWAVIAQHENLTKPGEIVTVDEVKKRFEEKLYPKGVA